MTAVQAIAYVAAALIAIPAAPAFAARKVQAQRGAAAASQYGTSGQRRFTDPDPNVQFELMRQQQWRKGGA